MIRKTKRLGGGWDVIHCHGSDKGRPINKKPFKTKESAEKMHKAIQSNKRKK